MNQIKFLPQDLIKAADNKAETSGVDPRSQDRDDSFSSLVEQHSHNEPGSRSDRQSNKSGNPSGNESGKGAGKSTGNKGGNEASRVSDSEKNSDPVEPADKNAETVTGEVDASDTQAAKEAEGAENTGPGTSGKPDQAKDPQNLIDLLGASAKLLQQQVMGQGAGEQELTGDVNIEADIVETTADERSVLAKLKGLAGVHQPTTAKELNGQLAGQVSEGENPGEQGAEADGLSAEQMAKQADKAQTGSQDAELLAKLKGGEAEVKDKAGQAQVPLTDKKLSPQELMAKAQQELAAELKAKTGANGDAEATDEALTEKALAAVKGFAAESDNSGKKSILLNNKPGEMAKAAATLAAANNQAVDEAATEPAPEAGDNSAVADNGVKSAPLQNQTLATDNHRPLGAAAEHSEQGAGSQGGEQGKNSGSQAGQQSGSGESFMIKEEANQAQQHKAATTPVREQSTLAAQMNNSALANAETPQAHNSEHVLDSVATKVNAENLQTQKNNLTTLNEALNLRKDFVGPMKEKVMIMINQKIQQVEIRLDPPELGNMHVRVNLQNEQAAVNFLVQSQQAKEALEQGMGKLKDMLSQSGVDVGDTNVAQQQQGSGDNGQGFGHGQQGNGRENHGFEQQELVMQASLQQVSASGVDYYA
ncbi:flagellar hook-length control protein FliK [Thalassomonas haliotis]|uniref:Flagellar hook-length control protein FliK n=1 Tax=Thalassomonas haliotis TaxID=485448 RepID=A0ABY7VJR7_9GAMM|nr:flagellar hook-length control protein FliK [Thalassomonas haliotis]WDE13240.1 flagellar hook-length control protein FliK [Thalassomonas haliotis]